MNVTPGPGAWPLSAPATALLRDPRAPQHLLLRLALRELVVRGVVRVSALDRRRWRPSSVRLAPGAVTAAGLPSPLALLAEALLPRLAAEGTDALQAVQKAAGWRADLATRVRDGAREELRAAGLLAQTPGRLLGVIPRSRWTLTPSGRAWAGSAADSAVAAAAVLPATGLLLVLDQELQRRLRDAAGVEVPAAWGDADGLDAVLGDAGPALDGAADGGSSSGDGGDGGGGGGGGD